MFDSPVQPCQQKYFCFLPTQIICLLLAVPALSKGRIAIVTDVGGDAVDANALLTNSADADGEIVWS